jgi:hypothetical protein
VTNDAVSGSDVDEHERPFIEATDRGNDWPAKRHGDGAGDHGFKAELWGLRHLSGSPI